MAGFGQRWAAVDEEAVTTLRHLLLGVLTASGRRTLDGGIRQDMIARSGMVKDDLLDFARDLVRKDTYWNGMPAAVRTQMAVLRGDIQNITDKMQAWE